MIRQLTLDNVQHAGRNELVNYLREDGMNLADYDAMKHSDLLYFAIDRLRAHEKGRDPRRSHHMNLAEDANARIQYERMRASTRAELLKHVGLWFDRVCPPYGTSWANSFEDGEEAQLRLTGGTSSHLPCVYVEDVKREMI